MKELVRFGVSIEQDLLENFDKQIAEKGYVARSEAIRDLIRDSIIKTNLQTNSDRETVASLTLIYEHHASNLLQEMAKIQHDNHNLILSVMHLHVSHDDCLEVIALKGKLKNIKEFAAGMLALKGIKHGELFTSFPSTDITN